MKLSFSIVVLHAEGRLHYRLLELGRLTHPATLLHNTLRILTFIKLADAFIQSDLQLRNTISWVALYQLYSI